MGVELLPSSAPRESRGAVIHRGIPWVPLFCPNCGKRGPWVPEAAVQAKAFMFWMCVPCAEKWQPLVDTMVVPDDVFWDKVQQAQLEEYGHPLTEQELVEALKDGHSPMSKLARERA